MLRLDEIVIIGEVNVLVSEEDGRRVLLAEKIWLDAVVGMVLKVRLVSADRIPLVLVDTDG